MRMHLIAKINDESQFEFSERDVYPGLHSVSSLVVLDLIGSHAAPLDALLDADGGILRQIVGEFLEEGDVDIVESGGLDVGRESKVSSSGGLHSGILVVECGDEHGGFATHVLLKVDRALGKDSHHSRPQCIPYKLSEFYLFKTVK